MKQSIKEWIFILLFLCAAPCLSSCGQKKEPVVQYGFYFDTVVAITLYGDSDSLSPLFEEIFALCARYDALFDRTAQGSDIARINESAGTPVLVDPETVALLQTACSYSELTGGLIDPTVTPLLLLWGFGNAPEILDPAPAIPPEADALADACSHVDYHSIVIDEQAGTVMLTDPHAAVDLGFIAKGYIADRIRDYLISEGVTSAVVNLGGNALCLGEKPDRSPYRVAVKYPFGDTEDVIATLPVRGQSVVTSGVYERFVETDGIRYHHILNPQTGYPVENGLLSVTIVTDFSTSADALSTACFVLGLSDGMALVESLDHTEALFITEDYELHYSSGLKENR